MHTSTSTELPLAGSSGGCCGGSSCGCGSSAQEQPSRHKLTQEENLMTEQDVQRFEVSGMTCGHCASAVTEEVKQLPGVSDVAVDLVAGGISIVRVTGTEPLHDTLVAAALEEAGDYRLA